MKNEKYEWYPPKSDFYTEGGKIKNEQIVDQLIAAETKRRGKPPSAYSYWEGKTKTEKEAQLEFILSDFVKVGKDSFVFREAAELFRDAEIVAHAANQKRSPIKKILGMDAISALDSLHERAAFELGGGELMQLAHGYNRERWMELTKADWQRMLDEAFEKISRIMPETTKEQVVTFFNNETAHYLLYLLPCKWAFYTGALTGKKEHTQEELLNCSPENDRKVYAKVQEILGIGLKI